MYQVIKVAFLPKYKLHEELWANHIEMLDQYHGVSECNPRFHRVSDLYHVIKQRFKRYGVSENHAVSRKLWCITDTLYFFYNGKIC